MSENKKYGYTGKGLRVDLTTGKITVEPTFPRFDGYIGGTAFGYKVFWDEVPPETDCYAPENKLVIAPGPLSGTGAICSGRTAITTLWTPRMASNGTATEAIWPSWIAIMAMARNSASATLPSTDTQRSNTWYQPSQASTLRNTTPTNRTQRKVGSSSAPP